MLSSDAPENPCPNCRGRGHCLGHGAVSVADVSEDKFDDLSFADKVGLLLILGLMVTACCAGVYISLRMVVEFSAR